MSYIGNAPTTGHFPVDNFTSSGGSTYTLSQAPATLGAIEVSVEGILQPTTAYSLSGTILTLTGVPSGNTIFVRHLGETLVLPTVADASITSAKIGTGVIVAQSLATNAVNSTHIANNAVTATEIADDAVTVAKIAPVDATPDTDHTANGPQTNTLNSGYSSTIMDLVYLGSSSKWLEADADATGTSINLLGIALEAKSDTQAMNVALPGSFVRDDSWSWTPGVPLYISNTLGAITATKPTGSGDVVRTVGYAVTADVIFFNPSSDYVTLA